MLVAAVMLVGVPWVIKALLIGAAAAHGILRRLPPSPPAVTVTEDGFCAVPEWHAGRSPLGARTLVCPFWVRLDLGEGPARRDIVLIADQVRPEEWRRLCALLSRVRCD